MLASRLESLMGLYAAMRCASIACSVTVAKPMVLSLSVMRYFGIDGLEDESFEAFADIMVEAKHGEIGIVDVVELCELKLHQVSLIMQ